MFRISKRSAERFKHIQEIKGTINGSIALSLDDIRIIEQTQVFSLGEKIELLQVALGNKLTTEIYMKIRSGRLHKKDIDDIEGILKTLPFSYYQDSLTRMKGSTKQMTMWFQVSVNEKVSEFMKSYADDMTEFEQGVLYGFPLSAIQAFAGLIDQSYEKVTPATFYLAGVLSKDFVQDEITYYELWWERLREISPKLVSQAEEACVNF